MKIEQLFNKEAFKAFIDSASKPGFKDAYAGNVLARQLTAVDPNIFTKQYPDLTFVNSGIQADNTGGYARRIQSLRVRELGEFRTAGDASDNKGKISLTSEDSFLKVRVREASSNWSDDEIKEADLQGFNLPSRFIEAHNKIYMREIDEIGYLGGDGTEGLLNYSGWTSTGATGTFDGLTAQQMYDDVSGLIQTQWNSVYNTPGYMADSIVMPIQTMNLLQAKIMDTSAGNFSVLKALQDNHPSIKFLGTVRATTDMVAFSTSREAMVMRIPVPLTIGEIVKISSFNFLVDSKYRVGGLDVLENTAGYVLTNVAA